jgi:GTP-binding protein
MNFNRISYVKSVLDRRDRPHPPRPEVVVMGRSNVGKSSLINTVSMRKNLARTSSTPGKTRLINYFLIDDKLYLVDLPGYGYIKKRDALSLKWDEVLGNFLLNNRQVKLVLLLIDSRHTELPADQYTISWLRTNDIPFAIILTKRDKISNNEYQQVWKKINREYPETTIVPFSAKNQTGRDEIIKLLAHGAGTG